MNLSGLRGTIKDVPRNHDHHILSPEVMGEQTPLMNVLDNSDPEFSSRSHSERAVFTAGPSTLLIAFLVFVCAFDSFFVVPPGTIGIVVTLGKVNAFSSGFHAKYPFFSELINLSAKTQKLEKENDIPTKEGLIVRLDTAV